MQLSTDQIRTIQKNVNLNVVPEGNKSLPQLKDAFGSHTFFVSDTGLMVFEEEKPDEPDDSNVQLWVVAVWEDEESSRLLPKEPPAPTQVVVDLETGDVAKRN